MIFCGAGKTTELRIKLLHAKVEEALDILSGLQQLPYNESEAIKAEHELGWGSLRDKILEILYNFGFVPTQLIRVPYTMMTEEESRELTAFAIQGDANEMS